MQQKQGKNSSDLYRFMGLQGVQKAARIPRPPSRPQAQTTCKPAENPVASKPAAHHSEKLLTTLPNAISDEISRCLFDLQHPEFSFFQQGETLSPSNSGAAPPEAMCNMASSVTSHGSGPSPEMCLAASEHDSGRQRVSEPCTVDGAVMMSKSAFKSPGASVRDTGVEVQTSFRSAVDSSLASVHGPAVLKSCVSRLKNVSQEARPVPISHVTRGKKEPVVSDAYEAPVTCAARCVQLQRCVSPRKHVAEKACLQAANVSCKSPGVTAPRQRLVTHLGSLSALDYTAVPEKRQQIQEKSPGVALCQKTNVPVGKVQETVAWRVDDIDEGEQKIQKVQAQEAQVLFKTWQEISLGSRAGTPGKKRARAVYNEMVGEELDDTAVCQELAETIRAIESDAALQNCVGGRQQQKAAQPQVDRTFAMYEQIASLLNQDYKEKEIRAYKRND